MKDRQVGSRPRRFAMTPDGTQLWVANELGASVSIIETTGHTVAATPKFEPKGFRADDVSPVGITMSADGGTAYITLGKANHVAVVDVASHRRCRTTSGRQARLGPHARSQQPGLFVANGLSDDVSVVDTATRKAVKTIRAGRVPHRHRDRRLKRRGPARRGHHLSEPPAVPGADGSILRS